MGVRGFSEVAAKLVCGACPLTPPAVREGKSGGGRGTVWPVLWSPLPVIFYSFGEMEDKTCAHSNVWATSFMYSCIILHIHTHIIMHTYIICTCNCLPQKIYLEMCRVLAAIHRVDIKAVGLSDFGKHGV